MRQVRQSPQSTKTEHGTQPDIPHVLDLFLGPTFSLGLLPGLSVSSIAHGVGGGICSLALGGGGSSLAKGGGVCSPAMERGVCSRALEGGV